jgi:hypothetical protein
VREVYLSQLSIMIVNIMLCKFCNKEQDENELDDTHLYCPHHSSGEGLTHLVDTANR